MHKDCEKCQLLKLLEESNRDKAKIIERLEMLIKEKNETIKLFLN